MNKDEYPENQDNWRPQASYELQCARAGMLKNIRAFFDARDVLEVETPILSQYSTTDPNLESLRSSFRDRTCYLNTSPEYAMKRLLAASHRSIYQICKAFRNDELGPNHNPEFTMLEWYRIGFDMSQLMSELVQLVEMLCDSAELSTLRASPAINASFVYLSYQQAFESFAGINPHRTDTEQCFQAATKQGIEIPQGLDTHSGEEDELNAWLDWLLIELVLPAFDKRRFTFLYDYPASQCALARIERNEQGFAVARRFELFFGETELANGFNELTDVHEQRLRFEKENIRRKEIGKDEAGVDVNFLDALTSGLPECSGVAVGLDRLLMVLTGTHEIDRVLAFPWRNA